MRFRTKICLLPLGLFIGACLFAAGAAPVSAVAGEYSQGLEAVKKIDAAGYLSNLPQYINQLKAQIAELQKKLKSAQGIRKESGAVKWCHNFKRDLRYGDRGSEVIALQRALRKQEFSGVDRDKTGVFGIYTASAVVGFQEKYRAKILKPLGLKHGTGFVGKLTRAKLNLLYGCGAAVQPVQPVPVEECAPGDEKKYTCPDGAEVDWCTCGDDEKWVCIDSPENQCKIKPDEARECTDTDGGKEYYVKGTACKTVSSGKTFCRTDVCLPVAEKQISALGEPAESWIRGKGLLKEYYCRDGKMLSRVYRCPNGCENGACVKQSKDLTCNQKCIAKGYNSGICRTWVVVPDAEIGCRAGEEDIGQTFDCSTPANLLGSGKTCCCAPLSGESEQEQSTGEGGSSEE